MKERKNLSKLKQTTAAEKEEEKMKEKAHANHWGSSAKHLKAEETSNRPRKTDDDDVHWGNPFTLSQWAIFEPIFGEQ